MFPSGTAGIALVILRCSVASALVLDLPRTAAAAAMDWLALVRISMLVVACLPAMALCVGFLTPYSSALGCLLELAALLRSGHHPTFQSGLIVLNTAVVGMLGPGAYSFDARIFGRRLMRFPTREPR